MRDNLDELRNIEGFPLGEDEDLHALSDPPHYTAYPNPHIAEFINKYGKLYDEATDDYHREPYVSDVSEGKNDPIYNAHSYHTKVPYKAIVPFIEHYTESGDIVFDGFCGTGMAGVAAQVSGRRAIIADLSTAATFIAFNYNIPLNVDTFARDCKKVLEQVEKECAWMYETKHSDGRRGVINYTVWSDIFICPYCGEQINFWDAAYDSTTDKLSSRFSCSKCQAVVSKSESRRAKTKSFDTALGLEVELSLQVPVLINYRVGTSRYEKRPDKNDIELIQLIQSREIPYWYPTERMPAGFNTEQPRASHGTTHVHHFYTKRNLWVLASLVAHLKSINPRYSILALSVAGGLVSLLTRYNMGHRGNGPVTGTLYIPSLVAETNVLKVAGNKFRDIVHMSTLSKSLKVCVTTQSTTDLRNIPNGSMDYIFTDPPFGGNLMYSELNFIGEAWLKVFTNNNSEAIVNNVQRKALGDYRDLMIQCFSEMYRILKPGRWITVEFHNSKASVWNAIQDSLSRAGFVVAQVTVLDKQQGSFKQVTSSGAVKNDLIINAYKPQAGFTKRLVSLAGRGLEVEFIRAHLHQLPLAANAERSKEMLYSKYLAYYIQHGYQVAYNGEQFYRALPQWGLVERDGYWFADEAQANEYEKRKVKAMPAGKQGAPLGQQVLFISDEKSARLWLWGFLGQPRSYDEIYTAFVRALQTPEDRIPELHVMLDEGFVRANGNWKRPDAFTQAELEKRRQERLLRQFGEYLTAAHAGQKLKEVRREALVAGFTEAYRESRFQDILTVGRRLDRRLLEESPEIFDFVDIAAAKVEG
ncbi:MAG: DNA methyltransferase [Chloroflexota bacterium]